MTNSTYITQSTLITMGWTKSMISKFMPEPKLVPNPHCKNAAPMKLYVRKEAIDIMDTDEFIAELEKANKRKQSARRAVETKTKKFAEKMAEIGKSINITIMEDDDLIATVLDIKEDEIYKKIQKHMDYLDRHSHDNFCYRSNSEYDSYEEYNEDYERTEQELEIFRFHRPNDNTLNRWCVNYIRHQLTTYDNELYELIGKIGRDDAYEQFKKAVLEKISIAYPKYADECKRQIEKIGESTPW